MNYNVLTLSQIPFNPLMISASSEEVHEAGESSCERLLSYWAEREAYDKVATMEYVD